MGVMVSVPMKCSCTEPVTMGLDRVLSLRWGSDGRVGRAA